MTSLSPQRGEGRGEGWERPTRTFSETLRPCFRRHFQGHTIFETALAFLFLHSVHSVHIPSRLPTASEGAVEGDGVQQAGTLELQEVLLGGVEVLLGEEDVEVAVHALLVARAG